MNRGIFLLGLFLSSTLASAAFADMPGVSRAERQRRYEERMRAERAYALAHVQISNEVGGIKLAFNLAGPGECEYALRGPQSGKDPGPFAATGGIVAEGPGRKVLVEQADIPEEGRYNLEALCRMKVVENTNFGPKETNREEEVRISRRLTIFRENGKYHVVQ